MVAARVLRSTASGLERIELRHRWTWTLHSRIDKEGVHGKSTIQRWSIFGLYRAYSFDVWMNHGRMKSSDDFTKQRAIPPKKGCRTGKVQLAKTTLASSHKDQ